MYYLQESESQCVLRRTFWFRIRLVSMQDRQLSSSRRQTSLSLPSGLRRMSVNAKSLLGVLSLGIVGGTSIDIIADGSDEQEAVDSLVALVESGFAE